MREAGQNPIKCQDVSTPILTRRTRHPDAKRDDGLGMARVDEHTAPEFSFAIEILAVGPRLGDRDSTSTGEGMNVAARNKSAKLAMRPAVLFAERFKHAAWSVIVGTDSDIGSVGAFGGFHRPAPAC
jgi:hypothetical protein